MKVRNGIGGVLAAMALMVGGSIVIAPAAHAIPVVCTDSNGNTKYYDDKYFGHRVWINAHKLFYGPYSCLNHRG